jgi:hypothetical protein
MASRDDLIDAVENGRMSPEEADAEALQLGLEPLLLKPDPAAYDPMRVQFWTPVMSVAWILWRTPDKVRQAWADYVAQCRQWRFHRWSVELEGVTQEGYRLEEYDPPSLVRLRFAEAAEDVVEGGARSKQASVAQAQVEFFDSLRTGALTATGLPFPEGGRRAEIPTAQWADLHYVNSSQEDRFVQNRAFPSGGYRLVLLAREQVVKLWKPMPPRLPLELPSIVRPDGAGYMTVFHALLWIATRGGAEALEPGDADRWHAAFGALMPEIASGHVLLTGERAGEREVVRPHVVASCGFDPPFAETQAGLLNGSDLYLRSYVFTDEEQWRNGYDDALVVGRQERWTRLMVPKEAVGKIWPFGLAVPRRTGAPGRPTSMHLVIEEFKRRAAAAPLSGTLAENAEALSNWVRQAHPTVPPPSPKTIKNKIRHDFNAARKT